MNLSQFIHSIRPVLVIAVAQKTFPAPLRISKKQKNQFQLSN